MLSSHFFARVSPPEMRHIYRFDFGYNHQVAPDLVACGMSVHPPSIWCGRSKETGPYRRPSLQGLIRSGSYQRPSPAPLENPLCLFTAFPSRLAGLRSRCCTLVLHSILIEPDPCLRFKPHHLPSRTRPWRGCENIFITHHLRRHLTYQDEPFFSHCLSAPLS